jgi:hypothetical protein
MARKGRARLRALIERVREEHPSLDAARASAGAEAAGWLVGGLMESPVTGRRGSTEFLLHGWRRERR